MNTVKICGNAGATYGAYNTAQDILAPQISASPSVRLSPSSAGLSCPLLMVLFTV